MSHCCNLKAQVDAYTPVGGASSPKPQLLPREGTTPAQQKCIDLAYILYLLEFHNPDISQQDAYDNYLSNFDACYGD